MSQRPSLSTEEYLSMGIASFAQNFEDIMLWRVLGHVEHGFYVDIGADDPVRDSVSMAFYQRGWRGLHVEPLSEKAQRLREERRGEIVIEAALGDRDGTIDLYVTGVPGLHTCDAEIAARHASNGILISRRSVPCLTMDRLLVSHTDRAVHWMRIDAEGAEPEVIRGFSGWKVRPWVLVVRAIAPNLPEPTHQAWESDLLGKGYRFAYFDGLSRFYVAEEKDQLLARFDRPPNLFDEFTLADSHRLVAPMVANRLRRSERELEETRHALAVAERKLQLARSEQATSAGRSKRLMFGYLLVGTSNRDQTAKPTPVRPRIRLHPGRAAVWLAARPVVSAAARPLLRHAPGLRRRLQSQISVLRERETLAAGGIPTAMRESELSADANRVLRALQRAARAV
jgi:FkbM family methyltransferase